MKTAIYIEDGVVQLVLTPDNDFEKNALRSFEEGALTAKIFRGEFYDCRGGWTRQRTYRESMGMRTVATEDTSLILRMENPKLVPERPNVGGAVSGRVEEPRPESFHHPTH